MTGPRESLNQSAEDRAEAIFQAWLDAKLEGGGPEVSALCADESGKVAESVQRRVDDYHAAFRVLSSAAKAITPGTVFGPYEVVRELGRGAAGTVVEALELPLDRRVALKFLHAGLLFSRHGRVRFAREAVAMSRVRHRAVVSVYAGGEIDGTPFLATELVAEGASLADRIAAWRAAGDTSAAHYREVARLFREIADGLSEVHAQGVLHRDLKPANILMDGGHPKIADFGIASLECEATLTAESVIAGTPRYMAPEAHQAASHRGPASDIFALGATLYEALTFQPAFEGDTLEQIRGEVSRREPVRPRRRRSSIPPDLETLCLRCLGKSPSSRPGSASELRDELDRFLAGTPIQSRPISPLVRAVRWAARHPWPSAAAAVVLVGLTIAAWLWREIALANGDLEEALTTTGAWVTMRQPASFGPALELTREALLRQREVVGDAEHLPASLRASLLKDIGRGLVYIEEFSLAEETLRSAAANLGADADGNLVADVRLYLGWACSRTAHDLRELTAAEELLESVRRDPGSDAASGARSLWARNRIALCRHEAWRVHLAEGREADATQARDDAMRIWRTLANELEVRAQDDEVDLLALTLLDLAVLHRGIGTSEAQAVARRELDHSRRLYVGAFGPDHPELVYLDLLEGQLASDQGNPAAATEHLELARARVSRLYGRRSPLLLEVEVELLEAYLSAGDGERAAAVADRMLKSREQGLEVPFDFGDPEGFWRRIQNRRAEAEELQRG